MSKRVITFLFIVFLIAGGGAVVAAKKRQIRQLPSPGEAAIPVRVAIVRTGATSQVIETAAVVRADTASIVAAQTPGTILEVRVREGDPVRAGDVLALVDSRPLSDAVDSAAARLVAARKSRAVQETVFARDQTLQTGGAISQQALDLSEAQLANARAAEISAERAVSTARVQRGYAAVVAPYAGVITARMVEPGELAAPGKPLFSLERQGSVRVISKVSQESLRFIRPGAEAVFSSGESTIKATVSRVYPALDGNFLGSVETVLAHAPFALPNGSAIHAAYATGTVTGLTVPNEALVDGLDGTTVVRIVNGHSEPTPVQLLVRGAETSVVAGGIAAGDAVAIGLPSELTALTKRTPVAPSAGRP